MVRYITETAGSSAVPFTLLLVVAGCGGAVTPSAHAGPAEGRLLTAEQIEATGARNAWEALARGHVHLRSYESPRGEPVRLSRRGVRSLTSSSEPLVIVNGARTEGLHLLHHIAAGDIARIRVISGIDATRRYGTGAGGGAILIDLKGGHDP